MIGVFDSGIGGLSVVRALLKRFPSADVVYYGDTARWPYGTKSPDEVRTFSEENVRFLLRQGATSVIIGCHTASTLAGDSLRATFPDVPISGVSEFGIEDAIHASKTGRVVVLGTDGTAASREHERKLRRLDPHCRVTTLACSSLVPFIERDDDMLEAEIAKTCAPLVGTDADVAILACTHFPIAREAFAKALGFSVTLIDPAEDLASALHLSVRSASAVEAPVHRFVFSSPLQADIMAMNLLGDVFEPEIVARAG